MAKKFAALRAKMFTGGTGSSGAARAEDVG